MESECVRRAKNAGCMTDTQTGVIIKQFGTKRYFSMMSFGGQGKTILGWDVMYFNVYDTFSGTQLCESEMSLDSPLGAHWMHNDTFQFASCSKTCEGNVINIHKLQPNAIPPLCILSSFPIPSQYGKFSFSPVSFHASFITKTNTGVIILNIQNSKPLLLIEKVQDVYRSPGQFSDSGNFFACEVSGGEVHIWKNTPTGYVSWSSLRLRLSLEGFSWSPTSASILCWGKEGIQLLHPDNHPMSMPPHDVMSNPDWSHLVAYSTDQVYIATTRKGSSVVTVLDHLPGTQQQSINTGMCILEIRIVGNTIFVLDSHGLSSWDFKAGRTVHSAHEADRVTFNKPLAIYPSRGHQVLSHDCSQVIFTGGRGMMLYHINDARITANHQYIVCDLQLSPSQHELWLLEDCDPPLPYGYVQNYSDEPIYDCVKLGLVDRHFEGKTTHNVGDGWSWINLFNPHGYNIGKGTRWITDSRGRKLLWLPPNWRPKGWWDVRWNGNFLAFVGGHHPEPIIVEFHSQPLHV